MAAPTHVQALSLESVGQVSSLVSGTFTSTDGNCLVVAAIQNGVSRCFASTDVPSPVTDNKGNTFVSGNSGGTAAEGVDLVLAASIAGGSGHTITLSQTPGSPGTTAYFSLAIEEVAGASAAYPLDQGNDVILQNAGASTNPHAIGGTLTPSVANTLVISAITNANASNNTMTPSGTAVLRTAQTGTTNQPVALATDARANTSGVVPAFTFSPNDGSSWAIACMSVKPDSGLPQEIAPLAYKGADYAVAQPAST